MATDAFVSERSAPRDDNGREVSINWEDEDSVLGATMKDQNVAAGGVARLLSAQIDAVVQLVGLPGTLTYERAPIEGNPHHGNLVYGADVPKFRERQIAASLALAAVVIPRR